MSPEAPGNRALAKRNLSDAGRHSMTQSGVTFALMALTYAVLDVADAIREKGEARRNESGA